MAGDPFYLVRVPFRADGMVRVARRRGLPLRHLDDGYLAHCILRELWQGDAPAPFELRGRARQADAWGYASKTADELIEHARAFGDPALLDALDGGCEQIVSKAMPEFARGSRLGFRLRVCPVVRLSNGCGGDAGREVDAFLARCWSVGDGVPVSRESVYRDWLASRLTAERAGVRLEQLAIEAFQRGRFVRRSQGSGGDRVARMIERPDLRVCGELTVEDSARFAATLRRGIGRHRAFGFGMLLLVPPGRARQGDSEWS